MQRTLQSLLTLRDYERRTVSSDIHDGFVQEVISASMFLEALSPRIDEDDKIAQQQLRNLEHSIKQAIAEGRRLVNRNQMLEVDEIGLLPAIQRLVANHNAKFGIVATLRYAEDIPELDVLHQRCVYRVVQEALTNVRRHSGSLEAIVSLYTDGSSLCVDISDQGRGFDSQSVLDESFGLRGMMERVQSLGGELAVRTAIGEGTLVSARLPLERAEQVRIVGQLKANPDTASLPPTANPESDLT
jgi:two-component system sensor histidine kinase DegS